MGLVIAHLLKVHAVTVAVPGWPGIAFDPPGRSGRRIHRIIGLAKVERPAMSKAGTVSPRFVWLAAILPLAPDYRVLEVGCGHGIALGLVAERVTSGVVTGVDRSAKMITAAARRNAAHIEAGRVGLRTASLHELADNPGSFDVIFAMNVASFQTRPKRDLVAARRLLVPGGALCLSMQQPPWGKREATFLEEIGALLTNYGFVVTNRYREDVEPYPVVAVIARVSSETPALDDAR